MSTKARESLWKIYGVKLTSLLESQTLMLERGESINDEEARATEQLLQWTIDATVSVQKFHAGMSKLAIEIGQRGPRLPQNTFPEVAAMKQHQAILQAGCL